MNNEVAEKILRVLADDLPWTIEQLHNYSLIGFELSLEQTSDILNEMVTEGLIVPAFSSEHGHGFTIAGPEQSDITDLALAVLRAEALVKQKQQELTIAQAALSHEIIALTVHLCEGNNTPSIERECVSIDVGDTSALLCTWDAHDSYEMRLTLRL